VTLQVSKRASAPAATGPDERAAAYPYLVAEPNAGAQVPDEVMREPWVTKKSVWRGPRGSKR